MTKSKELPKLLDYQGVADLLGVTQRHVRHLVAQRRIPHIRWGRLVRFEAMQIAEWLEEATVEPRHEPRRYW